MKRFVRILAELQYGPRCRGQEPFCFGRTKNASGFCDLCQREMIVDWSKMEGFTYYSIAKGGI